LNKSNWLIIPLLLLLTLTLAAPLTFAQDSTDEHPLMQILALVPDIPEVREAGITISYADYEAALTNREGAAQPESFAEFEALTTADDISASLALWALPQSGPPNFSQNFMLFGELPELVGFDFFDIEQAAYFGQPPSIGVILSGDFDADEISTAFRARRFVESDLNGMPLFCGPDGCEEGLRLNLRDRNPANPFGGDFGRQEPILLAPGYILNSADYGTVEAMAAVMAGEQPSLANDPSYHAAVEAIISEGTLIQAQFIEAASLRSLDVANLLLNLEQTEANIEAVRSIFDDIAEIGELPPYSLATIADVIMNEQQYAVIALVYDDAESAAAAGEVLVKRAENVLSFRVNRPVIELITERGASIEEPRVYTSEETGKSVALFAISGPLPPSTPDEEGRIVQSGLLYRLLANMLYSRDLYWLASDIPQFEPATSE
jgi:hypothetical protein